MKRIVEHENVDCKRIKLSNKDCNVMTLSQLCEGVFTHKFLKRNSQIGFPNSFYQYNFSQISTVYISILNRIRNSNLDLTCRFSCDFCSWFCGVDVTKLSYPSIMIYLKLLDEFTKLATYYRQRIMDIRQVLLNLVSVYIKYHKDQTPLIKKIDDQLNNFPIKDADIDCVWEMIKLLLSHTSSDSFKLALKLINRIETDNWKESFVNHVFTVSQNCIDMTDVMNKYVISHLIKFIFKLSKCPNIMSEKGKMMFDLIMVIYEKYVHHFLPFEIHEINETIFRIISFESEYNSYFSFHKSICDLLCLDVRVQTSLEEIRGRKQLIHKLHKLYERLIQRKVIQLAHIRTSDSDHMPKCVIMMHLVDAKYTNYDITRFIPLLKVYRAQFLDADAGLCSNYDMVCKLLDMFNKVGIYCLNCLDFPAVTKALRHKKSVSDLEKFFSWFKGEISVDDYSEFSKSVIDQSYYSEALLTTFEFYELFFNQILLKHQSNVATFCTLISFANQASFASISALFITESFLETHFDLFKNLCEDVKQYPATRLESAEKRRRVQLLPEYLTLLTRWLDTEPVVARCRGTGVWRMAQYGLAVLPELLYLNPGATTRKRLMAAASIYHGLLAVAMGRPQCDAVITKYLNALHGFVKKAQRLLDNSAQSSHQTKLQDLIEGNLKVVAGSPALIADMYKLFEPRRWKFDRLQVDSSAILAKGLRRGFEAGHPRKLVAKLTCPLLASLIQARIEQRGKALENYEYLMAETVGLIKNRAHPDLCQDVLSGAMSISSSEDAMYGLVVLNSLRKQEAKFEKCLEYVNNLITNLDTNQVGPIHFEILAMVARRSPINTQEDILDICKTNRMPDSVGSWIRRIYSAKYQLRACRADIELSLNEDRPHRLDVELPDSTSVLSLPVNFLLMAQHSLYFEALLRFSPGIRHSRLRLCLPPHTSLSSPLPPAEPVNDNQYETTAVRLVVHLLHDSSLYRCDVVKSVVPSTDMSRFSIILMGLTLLQFWIVKPVKVETYLDMLMVRLFGDNDCLRHLHFVHDIAGSLARHADWMPRLDRTLLRLASHSAAHESYLPLSLASVFRQAQDTNRLLILRHTFSLFSANTA